MTYDINNLPHLDTVTGPGEYQYRGRRVVLIDKTTMWAVHVDAWGSWANTLPDAASLARRRVDKRDITAVSAELRAARRLLREACKQYDGGCCLPGRHGALYPTPDAAVDAAIREEIDHE